MDARREVHDWWAKAKHDFDDVRAVSFYRYQAVAFKDLYGVDFDAITDDQAADLDRRIFRNYLTKDWLYEVVTQKANIELMFNDPYWARFDFRTDYPFGVLVLNVTTLTRGFHPSRVQEQGRRPVRVREGQRPPREHRSTTTSPCSTGCSPRRRRRGPCA